MAANMSPASDTILVDVVFVYRTHYEKRSTAEPIMISKRPQDKRTLKTCLLQKFEIMMSHPDSRLFILETIIGFELDKWMRKLRQKSVRVGLMRILWSDGLKTGLHEDNLEKALAKLDEKIEGEWGSDPILEVVLEQIHHKDDDKAEVSWT